MTNTLPVVSLEELQGMLPRHTSLVYVDYNDNLNDKPSVLQTCIRANNYEAIWEEIEDWFNDAEHYNTEEYIKQLEGEIETKYDLEYSDAVNVVHTYREELIDTIRDRCTDDTVADLLRNTRKQVVYYDTGLSIGGALDEAGIGEVISNLVTLGLINTPNLTTTSTQMLNQSYYGGNIVIYFYADIEGLIGSEVDYTKIVFDGYYLCVNDQWNGSGDHCFIKQPLTLPFDRKNLKLCKVDEYSYTYKICGMSSDWCEDTKWKLS